MPITLITGLPGNGKTLYLLAQHRKTHETRPVFYANIKGLKLPWQEWEPQNWQNLPAGALFIIDEAQQFFPVRGRGEPPKWIEELAKHRHLGLDFILVTQGPMLIDSFVRALVQTHFDVCRVFGTQFANIHEFTSGVHEACRKNHKGSIVHKWKYDKSVFELYTSAELHTVKARIPAKVFLLAAMPLVIGAIVWAFMQRSEERVNQTSPETAASAPELKPGQPGQTITQAPSNYAQVDFRPRVAGMPHTAPAYDHLTAPVEAPYPAYCISLGTEYDCKCYTQRNTGLQVPRPLCETIAREGFFAYWRQLENSRAPAQAQQNVPPAFDAPQAPQVSRVPQASQGLPG